MSETSDLEQQVLNQELGPEKLESGDELSTINRILLVQILREQLSARNRLPFQLGLCEFEYQRLLKILNHSDLTRLSHLWKHPEQSHEVEAAFIDQLNIAIETSDITEQLRLARLDEWQALVDLLITSLPTPSFSSNIVAEILATACFQPSHLWQNLGLSSRQELTELLQHNFPDLTAKNTKKMRWKRFFYLQLCEQGGDYVCRAPSCDQCTSFSECFGPE